MSLEKGLPVFTKYDVALFIEEKGTTRWSELLKKFVENGTDQHITRQRLSNYLKELREEGLISKTIDPKTAVLLHIIRPIYKVSKNGKKRLREVRDKKEIYEFIDSAGPEEIEKLHEEIKRLKKLEEFF